MKKSGRDNLPDFFAFRHPETVKSNAGIKNRYTFISRNIKNERITKQE